jgi:alpha,alpha-trehalase
MKLEFIHQLGELFEEVQMQNILADGKTFPDCIPNRSLAEINAAYLSKKNSTPFDLKEFVAYNFTLPRAFATAYKSNVSKPVPQHIDELWNVLTRQPEKENSSLIPLQHPYIVPGGRFREIYYWDSYFTMLGLKASGRIDLIKNMVANFAFLIEKFGYIPNGNRSYFLGRSQPPFFSLMVKLLSEVEDDLDEDEVGALAKYLPAMEREYQFWMRGSDQLSATVSSLNRVVRLPEGEILNRYWDANDTPRPESYKEDVELSQRSKQRPSDLYRNIRAAAESGWDFSSRWFKDEKSFDSIHTTDIIPVDLNCLLEHLEKTLSDAYLQSGNKIKSSEYLSFAKQRKAAIKKYCWSKSKKFFFDYDFIEQKQKEIQTLAAAFPLFFEIASPNEATAVKEILQQKFLKHGGLTTTLNESGQQWDAPNGWAPLQWVAYQGLLNYGFDELADQLKTNWTNINIKVYKQTGKLTEKYNVFNETGEGGGGEYPNQDGFGWTNGVLRAMLG